MKCATNIDDFDADIFATVHKLYDKVQFPTSQTFLTTYQQEEEPCVIEMENCPYHSVLVQNCPKSNDNKATFQKWPTENGVEFASFETFSEL